MRHIIYILIVLVSFSSCTPEPYYEYDDNPPDSSIIWYNIKPVEHTEMLRYTAKLTIIKHYNKHPLGKHSEVITLPPTINETYPNDKGTIGGFSSIKIGDKDYFNWSVGETVEEINGVKVVVDISSVEFNMLVTPYDDLEYVVRINNDTPKTTSGEINLKTVL